MKKNPLLLTFAVSALAPNVMAQVDATSQIANPGFEEGVKDWTADGFKVADTDGEVYAVDKKFMKLTSETGKLTGTLTQKISGLPKGKYTLSVKFGTDATSTGTHFLVVGVGKDAKLEEYNKSIGVEVGAGDDLFIGYQVKDAEGTYLGVDAFELTLSEATAQPVIDAYSNKLAVVVTKANGVETDDKISAALKKVAEIQTKINDFNFEDYKDYVAKGEESEINLAIEDLEEELVAAVENKKQYDALLASYNDIDFTALNEAVTNCNPSYKDIATKLLDETKANYDALKNTLEDSYAAGTVVANKDAIAQGIEGINKAITDNAESIENGSTNDMGYLTVKGYVDQAKTAYLLLSNRLFACLSGEWDDVYGDYFVEASMEINPYLKQINAIEAENNENKTKGNCGVEGYADTYGPKLVSIIADATTIVEKWETTASTLQNAWSGYVTQINALEKNLDDVVENADELGEEEFYFTADTTAINASIDALWALLDKNNREHKFDDTFATAFATASTEITTSINSLNGKIALREQYFENRDAVAEAQALYDKTLAEVNALKSKDEKYSVDGKLSDTTLVKKNIVEYLEAWPGIVDGWYGNSESKDLDTTDVRASITTLKEQATAAVANYNAVAESLVAYSAEVDTLVATAVDPAVTTDGDPKSGNTYAKLIAGYKKAIEEKTAEIDSVVALTGDAHVNGIMELAVFSDDDITAVQTQTDDYAENADKYNAEQLNIAKERMLKECKSALTTIDVVALNGRVYEKAKYGMHYVDLKAERDSIVNVYNELAADVEEAGKPDVEPQKAIALLTTILSELDKLNAAILALDAWEKTEADLYAKEVKAREGFEEENAALLLILNGDGTDEHKGIINGVNTDTNPVIEAYFANKVDSINGVMSTLMTNVGTSFDNETLVSDSEKIVVKEEGKADVVLPGYTEQFQTVRAAVDTLVDEAKASTANLEAKDSIETKAEEVSGVITAAETKIDEIFEKLEGDYAYSDSQEEYEEFIADFRADVADYKEQILIAYGKGEAASHLADFSSKLDAISKSAEALPANYEANEAAFKAQVDSFNVVDAEWEVVYNYIITQAELDSTLKASMSVLAAEKENLKACETLINESHAGAQSVSVNEEVLSSLGISHLKIDAVMKGWGDTYKQEVANYNMQLMLDFNEKYQELSAAYVKAVQLVDQMNQTKWAAAENVQAALNQITQSGNLYSYAEKIRTLKADIEAAYNKIVPPVVFDAAADYIAKADEYKKNVEDLYNTYAATVNELALAEFEPVYDEVDGELKSELQTVNEKLLAANGQAQYLATENPYEGAFTQIIKDLKNTKNIANESNNQFALQFDSVLTVLDGIEGRIAEAKETDGYNVFRAVYQAYNKLRVAERNEIKTFHNEDGVVGAYSQLYEEWCDNNVKAAYNRFVNSNISSYYAEMTQTYVNGEMSLHNLLAQFNASVTQGGGHTLIYNMAKAADQAYNENNTVYNNLLAEVSKTYETLDSLNEFRLPLVVCNSIQNKLYEFSSNIISVKTAITSVFNNGECTEEYGNAQKATLEGLRTSIRGWYTNVLNAEYASIESLLVTLRLDYSLAEAEALDADSVSQYAETIDACAVKNKEIIDNYRLEDGEKGKLTAEEARTQYIELEETIATTRKALLAIYNEGVYASTYETLTASIATVQEAIDTEAAFTDCHAAVVNKFQDEVNEYDNLLKLIKDKVDERYNAGTLLIYAENYTEDINIVASYVTEVAEAIDAEEKLYDTHDRIYAELSADIDALKNKYNEIATTLGTYEFKVPYLDEELADVLDDINEQKENLDEINENADFETDNYFTQDGVLHNAVLNAIALMDEKITEMLHEYSAYNAINVLGDRRSDYIEANGLFSSTDSHYTPEDKAALLDTRSSILDTYYNINAYVRVLNSAYNNPRTDWANFKHAFYNDVNGNEIERVQLTAMEIYAAVMPAIDAYHDAVTAWAEDVADLKYNLGDVDHNKRINVNDYILVRNMVLGVITEETEGINSAAFYAADVDGNGQITIADLTQVANHIMTGEGFQSALGRSLATANQNNTDAISAVVNGTGTHQQLVISLNNSMEYVGAQMDIVLPAGVSIVNERLAERASGHELFSNDVNGAHRVVISDINNAAFIDGDQTLLVLDLEVSADFAGGELTINNAIFTTANGRGYSLQTAVGSGETGITDLTVTEKAASRIYSIGGQVMKSLRKGVNIIVNSDGTSKKVLNK